VSLTTKDVQEHLLPAHSVIVTKMEGTLMPYSAQHKQETRNRILRSARRLFNRKGFAEVTIDEIMAEAGLTRGGFYKHFTSKDDLYSEAISQFMCKDPPEAWQRKHVDLCAKGPTLARMISCLSVVSHNETAEAASASPETVVASQLPRLCIAASFVISEASLIVVVAPKDFTACPSTASPSLSVRD
jgi:AcrR family transcriptional regulator